MNMKENPQVRTFSILLTAQRLSEEEIGQRERRKTLYKSFVLVHCVTYRIGLVGIKRHWDKYIYTLVKR